MFFCFLYRFNSVVGIEMIDNINKIEYRFDFMVLIGKFGMKKVNYWCFKSFFIRGREG